MVIIGSTADDGRHCVAGYLDNIGVSDASANDHDDGDVGFGTQGVNGFHRRVTGMQVLGLLNTRWTRKIDGKYSSE